MKNQTQSIIFVDQPTDLILPCIKGTPSYDYTLCVMNHVLGILSGIVFPLYATFSMVTNSLTFVTFLFLTPKPTRLMIYLACLAMADILTVITFGWFWLFPAKGLPYLSSGKISFFTFNQGETACKLHRFLITFSSSLACNFLVLAVADRTWSVYFPAQTSKIGSKAAWYFVMADIVISFFFTMPFGLTTAYIKDEDTQFTSCILINHGTFMAIFQALFRNCGLVQSSVIFILNVFLMWKLKHPVKAIGIQYSFNNRRVRSGIISVMLFSLTFLMSSLMQVIGDTASLMLRASEKTNVISLKMAYVLVDYGWHLFLFQESLNWITYIIIMPQFKEKQMKILGINNRNFSFTFTPRFHTFAITVFKRPCIERIDNDKSKKLTDSISVFAVSAATPTPV